MQVIAITSGKGGVGKTTVAGNLSAAFAKQGARVLAIDADLGLADLNFVFGVRPVGSIKDVLEGTKTASEIIVKTPSGADLMPAHAGSFELANMTDADRTGLFSAIDSIQTDYDVVLVDTGAGLNANAMTFAAAASRVLVVVTPDPTSIADAYAVMKVLATKYHVREFDLLPNRVASAAEADRIFTQITRLTSRFLQVRVRTPGYLLADNAVEKALRSCEPFITSAPTSTVARSVNALASTLLKDQPKTSMTGGLQLFWQKLGAA